MHLRGMNFGSARFPCASPGAQHEPYIGARKLKALPAVTRMSVAHLSCR